MLIVAVVYHSKVLQSVELHTMRVRPPLSTLQAYIRTHLITFNVKTNAYNHLLLREFTRGEIAVQEALTKELNSRLAV